MFNKLISKLKQSTHKSSDVCPSTHGLSPFDLNLHHFLHRHSLTPESCTVGAHPSHIDSSPPSRMTKLHQGQENRPKPPQTCPKNRGQRLCRKSRSNGKPPAHILVGTHLEGINIWRAAALLSAWHHLPPRPSTSSMEIPVLYHFHLVPWGTKDWFLSPEDRWWAPKVHIGPPSTANQLVWVLWLLEEMFFSPELSRDEEEKEEEECRSFVQHVMQISGRKYSCSPTEEKSLPQLRAFHLHSNHKKSYKKSQVKGSPGSCLCHAARFAPMLLCPH